MKRSAISMS